MEKTYGKLERGMPINIPVSIYDKDNKPIDLTGQNIYFTVKPCRYDFDRDDHVAIITKNFISNSLETNSFVIELTAKDMDFKPGTYFFDIVIGGWRAICLEFELVGGPTNRSVLDYDDNAFSTVKRPIRIIQKAEKPIILISEFNPFLNNIREDIFEERFYPIEMKKVYGVDYLYEVYYDHVSPAKPAATPAGYGFGSCSAVRKGNFVGRNFDWYYDDSVTFVIHTPHIGSHYASVGVGRYSSLTKEVAETNPHHPDFKLLPHYLLDGINEHGLYVNTNVVPLDYGYEDTVPEVEELESIENLQIVRFILDRFKTADEAISYIRNFVRVYPSQHLVESGEALHFLIADTDHTYVVEFIHGEIAVVDAYYMTNFNVYGVTPNDDGLIYTPETQDAEHDAFKTNDVTLHGAGLERYNMIVANYPLLNSKAAFADTMKSIWYTRAYPSSPAPSDPYWYTELVGWADLKVNTPAADFAPTVEKFDQMYKERRRDNPITWQTVHSAVYDLPNKKFYLRVQEQDPEFEFSL